MVLLLKIFREQLIYPNGTNRYSRNDSPIKGQKRISKSLNIPPLDALSIRSNGYRNH
jgi:hypothetical protein